MRIEVSLTAGSLPERVEDDTTAVVLDVLRATSTICAALAAGCRAVIPVAEPAQAEALRHHHRLLGGERDAVRIPGFDLGNSPLEYTVETVGGREVVLTTTNGTRTLLGVAGARRVLAGAVVNARAVAAALRGEREVLLACAGTQGRFSLEDFAAAGLIIHHLAAMQPVLLSDTGRAARALYQAYAGRLAELFTGSSHGRHLIELGFAADLEWCAREDWLEVVPEMIAGRMVLANN